MKTPNLRELLKYRRPARSVTERQFIARYLDVIPGMITDSYGNRLLIRDGSKTMISVHTDTVHRIDGIQRASNIKGVIGLDPREKLSNCLGADDTAGIYAALRMIQAGVKATFIFHRDEEIGGKGSNWLATNYGKWLAGFDRCIALDRRGTTDIITHQAYGRCCSDGFADALASELGMSHSPSEHGIFTDSANYVGIIQECTNVSVGYEHEHSPNETLDTEYLERLIESLIAVDWDSLPTLDWIDDSYAYSYVDDTCEYCSLCYSGLYETSERKLACESCYRYHTYDLIAQ